MAQIVNDGLCLIRERIGSDSEKQFNSFKKTSVQRRNYDWRQVLRQEENDLPRFF
jgi:hypothetical protein